MQGFEANHVGVIIGSDLVNRNGTWVAQPKHNYRNELRRKQPMDAIRYIKRIYRTLLSRGMQSCSVFCVDEETRSYIQSRLLEFIRCDDHQPSEPHSTLLPKLLS